jgi:hypothetical protein
VSRIDFASGTSGEPLHYWIGMPADARSPVWIDQAWLAVTAASYPATSRRTLTLIRLGTDQVVVPIGAEHGDLGAPARLPR